MFDRNAVARAATFTLALCSLAVHADQWTPISVTDAPTARTAHSAVFTRIDGTDQMIVWGGQDANQTPFANTGGVWKRSSDRWTPTRVTNAPSGREGHPAVWTGREMIVWGGDDGLNFLDTGSRYDPVANVWRPMTQTGAPSPRFAHSMTWAGDRLIVWGGAPGFIGDLNTGGIYDSFADRWMPTATDGAPAARNSHAAVWTGSRLLIWGGISGGNYINDGALYNPRANTWAPIE